MRTAKYCLPLIARFLVVTYLFDHCNVFVLSLTLRDHLQRYCHPRCNWGRELRGTPVRGWLCDWERARLLSPVCLWLALYCCGVPTEQNRVLAGSVVHRILQSNRPQDPSERYGRRFAPCFTVSTTRVKMKFFLRLRWCVPYLFTHVENCMVNSILCMGP